jgi:penicillin-binding protein 1A
MNVQAGTGVGANPGFPAGGKTGTTDDFGDAWFAGITTNASTVVWVGYPNAKIPMTSVHGIRVAGGTFPATIWRLFTVGAFGKNPPPDWPQPTNPVQWEPFHGQYEFFGAPAPVSSAPPPTDTSGNDNGNGNGNGGNGNGNGAPPPPPTTTDTGTGTG